MSDELQQRQAEQLAAYQARRARLAADRAERAERRGHGLQQRHTAKLRRVEVDRGANWGLYAWRPDDDGRGEHGHQTDRRGA